MSRPKKSRSSPRKEKASIPLIETALDSCPTNKVIVELSPGISVKGVLTSHTADFKGKIKELYVLVEPEDAKKYGILTEYIIIYPKPSDKTLYDVGVSFR